MSEDLGPIVVDRYAYKDLLPALAVWLLLFVTAGDARTTVGHGLSTLFGEPAEAVVTGKSRRARRNMVSFTYPGGKAVQAVGAKGYAAIKAGDKRKARLFAGTAFLEDDLGYSRWKLTLFGAALFFLWAWAKARYRFG